MQHESVDVEANDIICHMTCLVTERNIQNQSKNMEIRRSKIQKSLIILLSFRSKKFRDANLYVVNL